MGSPQIPALTHSVPMFPFVSISFIFFQFFSIWFHLFQLFQFFSICFHLFQFFSEKECSKLLWNSEIRNMGVRWINVIVPSLKQRESFVSFFFSQEILMNISRIQPPQFLKHRWSWVNENWTPFYLQ